MDRYAVIGNPVKHSLSPRIHALFAQQYGQAISYEALEAPLDGFPAFVLKLYDAGYLGLNVTVPFKQQAWALADTLSEAAQMAEAVNTLIHGETGWRGDNTDGKGLVNDLLNNLHLSLNNQRVLILGAGGAVRGVLLPLLQQTPALLHIANRTATKAQALAAQFAHLGSVRGSGLEGPYDAGFDLIINGTASSLQGSVPDIPPELVKPDTLCYDMMYADSPTAFVAWGRRQGAAQSVDGLGMLVEQAAESFYLWRGQRPQTKPVLQQLRPMK